MDQTYDPDQLAQPIVCRATLRSRATAAVAYVQIAFDSPHREDTQIVGYAAIDKHDSPPKTLKIPLRHLSYSNGEIIIRSELAKFVGIRTPCGRSGLQY